jgi:hypothetical protein
MLLASISIYNMLLLLLLLQLLPAPFQGSFR